MAVPQPSANAGKNIHWVNLLIVAVILILLVINIITFPSELRWVGHAALSVFGFVLIIVAAFTGAVLKGRIRGFHLRNLFLFHKRISILASLVVTGTFLLGILTTMEHVEPPLESLHGLVGLIVSALALLQLMLSLAIKERTKIRVPHRILGYTLVLLVVLQIVLGIQAAGYI